MLDMTHKIHHLSFGENAADDGQGTNSLSGFNSEKEIE